MRSQMLSLLPILVATLVSGTADAEDGAGEKHNYIELTRVPSIWEGLFVLVGQPDVAHRAFVPPTSIEEGFDMIGTRFTIHDFATKGHTDAKVKSITEFCDEEKGYSDLMVETDKRFWYITAWGPNYLVVSEIVDGSPQFHGLYARMDHLTAMQQAGKDADEIKAQCTEIAKWLRWDRNAKDEHPKPP